MPKIAINDGETTFAADFEPVRTIRSYTLGWATVEHEGDTFRFPAITHTGGHVVTVRDWQASFESYDLADPEQVREMLGTGQGKFMSPRTRNDSDIGNHFAR